MCILREVKEELHSVITKCKRSCRDKIEEQLHDADDGNAWRGIRNMVGMNEEVKDGRLSIPVPDSKSVDELSEFYGRFDVLGKQVQCGTVCEDLDVRACPIQVTRESDVVKCFVGLSEGKVCGPDDIKCCMLYGSAGGMSRRRPLEFGRKVNEATRSSGACSHT